MSTERLEAEAGNAARAPVRLQAVRGMNDVLPDEAALWERFEDTVRREVESSAAPANRRVRCVS